MKTTGRKAKQNQIILNGTLRHSGIGCRMSKLASLLLILGLMMGCLPDKPDPRNSVAEYATYLDKRIPHLLKKYDIPGVSMALLRHGEMVWSGAYGYADLANKRIMSVDAVCRVESISKSVTAWGVMRLVEQGLLELDAPIKKHLRSWELPDTHFDQNKITIRRLLSNNAGLPLGAIGKAVEYPPQSTTPTLLDYLSQEVHLIREAGSGFLYSNVGFNLLEFLIEEVTGRDFATYMAEEVLTPLGMNHASFAWDSSFHAAIPTGYETDGTAVPPYVYPVKASGGLFATAEDIGRFVCAEMTGLYYSDHSVLNLESIRQIHQPQVTIPGLFGFVAEDYGFGHFVETLSDNRKAVWHGGQGHGWMTHFHATPERGDGIVILANSQRSWPFMAQVLTDWSRWQGIEPVKMSRIISATKVMWVLIGLLVLISLWQSCRFINGLVNGTRRFAPLMLKSAVRRLLQMIISVFVIIVLAWSAAQPYLFVSSIFPNTVNWAAFSLLALSLINIISACFIGHEKESTI